MADDPTRWVMEQAQQHHDERREWHLEALQDYATKSSKHYKALLTVTYFRAFFECSTVILLALIYFK